VPWYAAWNILWTRRFKTVMVFWNCFIIANTKCYASLYRILNWNEREKIKTNKPNGFVRTRWAAQAPWASCILARGHDSWFLQAITFYPMERSLFMNKFSVIYIYDYECIWDNNYDEWNCNLLNLMLLFWIKVFKIHNYVRWKFTILVKSH